jgi:hypothetical protein
LGVLAQTRTSAAQHNRRIAPSRPIVSKGDPMMHRRLRIAIAATVLGLAAVSASSASAFYGGFNPFAWRAVPIYGIPY